VRSWLKALGRGDRLTLLALPALLAAVHVLHDRQGGELSVQSELNLRFANRPSLTVALERYPKLRPPLYPSLLWVASRVGVPLDRVNEALLDLTLLSLLLLLRRTLPGVNPLWPTTAYALAHFNYTNLQQFTGEALFVPLMLGVLFFLWWYQRSGSAGALAGLTATLALLCLTRYFALSSAVPLVLAHVLLLSPGSRGRRLAHAAVLILCLVPVGLWMAFAYRETGYWTGAARAAPRHLPEAVRHWSELTTLPANVRLLAKTFFVDFFSPTKYAAHSVVTHPYRLSPFEWIVLGVLVVAVLAGGAAVLRAWRERRREGLSGVRAWVTASPASLAAEFLVVYVTLTVAVWTGANNDPLYTRFLYPCYFLAFLTAFPFYAWLKAHPPWRWSRLPFVILLGMFLVAQCVRNWQAEALPVRFME